MNLDTREYGSTQANIPETDQSLLSSHSQLSVVASKFQAKKLGPLEEYEYEVPEYRYDPSGDGTYLIPVLRVFPIIIAILLVPVLFTSIYGDDSFFSFKRHYCTPYIVLSAVGLFYAILQIAVTWMSQEKLRWAFWPGLVMMIFYVGCIGGGSIDSIRSSSTAFSVIAAVLHMAWLVLSSLHLRQLCCFELLGDVYGEYLPLTQNTDSSAESEFLPLDDRHWTNHAGNAIKVLPVIIAIMAVSVIIIYAAGVAPVEHGITTIVLAAIAFAYSPLQNLGAHRKRNLIRWAFWVGILVAIVDIVGIIISSHWKDVLTGAVSIIFSFLHIAWVCIVGSSLRLFCCTNAPFIQTGDF